MSDATHTPDTVLSAEEEGRILLANPGLQAVSDWTIGNSDVAADDTEITRQFAESVDGLLDVTERSLARLRARDARNTTDAKVAD